MSLTAEEITMVLGPSDNTARSRICATGATIDDLQKAHALVSERRKHPDAVHPEASGVVGQLVAILSDR